MSGRATLATARLRLATPATRISVARTTPARFGLLDSIEGIYHLSRHTGGRSSLRGWGDERSQAAGGAARRTNPARGLAAAAGAALAGRPARQRLGGRRRRRHRPLRHRDRRQGPACASSNWPSARSASAIEDVRLLVCTHSHTDHYGLAGADRRGRRLRALDAPGLGARAAARRRPGGGARAADRGRPPERRPARVAGALPRGAQDDDETGIDAIVEPDRELLPGVEVETDLGTWQVYETPGHAPSHVVLHQPERKLMISGDHLLGRTVLFFDHGHTPGPARRVPRQPRRGRAARGRPGACPATAGPSATRR